MNKKSTFVQDRTDKYFTKTRKIVEMFGDKIVTYAVFQRRSVIVATKLAETFIKENCPNAVVTIHHEEGTVVPPQTKVMTINGLFSELVELETLWLQRLGFAQVAAYNAYKMSMALPNVPFLDMHGRHATGDDMVIAAAYGASVGSRTARLSGAKGFIGTSNDLTAHYYPIKQGLGTMPHAVVGYAGNNLDAVKMYLKANPDDTNIVALVDYFGKETTESLEIAKWFYENNHDAQGKSLGVRLDTHGGRFAEGLDYEKSVEVVCDWLKVFPVDEYAAVRKVVGDDVFDAAGDGYVDKVRKLLFGTGVSAANIINMRQQLDSKKYTKVDIIASSGFDLFKCTIMAKVNAPISMVGTGSFLPKTLSETYATADIVKYGDVVSVKLGREWLLE
jgi:nicotinate phosphoribosyltransferase